MEFGERTEASGGKEMWYAQCRPVQRAVKVFPCPSDSFRVPKRNLEQKSTARERLIVRSNNLHQRLSLRTARTPRMGSPPTVGTRIKHAMRIWASMTYENVHHDRPPCLWVQVNSHVRVIVSFQDMIRQDDSGRPQPVYRPQPFSKRHNLLTTYMGGTAPSSEACVIHSPLFGSGPVCCPT